MSHVQEIGDFTVDVTCGVTGWIYDSFSGSGKKELDKIINYAQEVGSYFKNVKIYLKIKSKATLQP